MTVETPIRFGIVGSGWRSEFFLRVAEALSERFTVTGLVTRSAETARAIEARWGIRTHSNVDDLIGADRPEFVVVSVPREIAPSNTTSRRF
jgi:predicted dehydrogenase